MTWLLFRQDHRPIVGPVPDRQLDPWAVVAPREELLAKTRDTGRDTDDAQDETDEIHDLDRACRS